MSEVSLADAVAVMVQTGVAAAPPGAVLVGVGVVLAFAVGPEHDSIVHAQVAASPNVRPLDVWEAISHAVQERLMVERAAAGVAIG